MLLNLTHWAFKFLVVYVLESFSVFFAKKNLIKCPDFTFTTNLYFVNDHSYFYLFT